MASPAPLGGDPRCRRDTRDARWLGRRHAKSLQPVQGRRELQGLGEHVPRTDRPRDRPRPGSDQRTAIALAYGSQVGIEYFPAKIRDMAAFLNDTLPKDHPLTGVTATPRTESVPEIWILASSEGSTTLAARYGMGLSYAHFINPSDTEFLLRLYRESFQPSAHLKQPALTMGSLSFAPRPKPRRSALSQAGTSTACAPTGAFTAQCQARRPPSLTRSRSRKTPHPTEPSTSNFWDTRQGQSQDRRNGRDIRLPRIHHSLELLRVRSPYPLL